MNDDEKWIIEDASDEELRDCLLNREPNLAVVSEAMGRMMDKIADLNAEMVGLRERTFKLESIGRPTFSSIERGTRGVKGQWPQFRPGSAGETVAEYCKANKGLKTKSGAIGREVKRGDSDVSTTLHKLADLGLIKRGKKMGYWIL